MQLESTDKLWAWYQHNKTRQNVHIIMCLETFYFGYSNSTLMYEQGLLVIAWYAHIFCHIDLQSITHNRDFLLHDLPKLLEDVPLTIKIRMWYMHGGAPAHSSRAVRNVLSNTYFARWIGRGEPNAWSPRSPDLNPLDFYLWEHLKLLVYAAPVDSEGALHQRIVDDYQQLPRHL
jgi:hypothetical protein